MKPAFSIIIPTYNRAHLLRRALTSVFQQSLPCKEVLVVDDGSNDATPSLLREIQAEAPLPLQIIRQENRGAAAARNAGLKRAKTEVWHALKLVLAQLGRSVPKPSDKA